MKQGKLPALYPVSGGGIFCLGLCLAAGFSKYNLLFTKEVILIFNILALLIVDGIFTFLKKTVSSRIKIFLLGAILFGALNLFQNTTKNPKYNSHESYYSISFSNAIDRLLKESELNIELQSVTKGLVLGSSRHLPSEIKTQAREGGILHLFAASGLHLGIFIGVTLFIFKKVAGFYRPLPYLLSLLCGFLYLLVLGFPVSFLRAYSFAVYSFLGIIVYRKTLSADTLCYSSAIVVIFLPSDFLSVGFLLSFGAVAGIFFIKPTLDTLFFPNNKNLLKDNFTLSLSCTIATFPILVYYFHSFSFGSFWINLIVVPLASALLPLLYLNLFCEWIFFKEPAMYLWKITDFFLSLFLRIVCELTESISYFYSWKFLPKVIFFHFAVICFLLAFVYFKNRFSSNPIASKNQRETKFKKRILSICVAMVLLGFFPIGVWVTESEKKKLPVFQSWIQKGNFFIRFQKSFYFLGNCYSKSNFKKIETEINFKEIENIFWEQESCLPYSSELKKQITRVTTEKKINTTFEKKGILPVFFHQSNTMSSLVRFDGDKRRLTQLLVTLRRIESYQNKIPLRRANYLVLDFPVWSKEKADDWKKFQKLLGISTSWKIMSVEELSSESLYHTHGDPKLPHN